MNFNKLCICAIVASRHVSSNSIFVCFSFFRINGAKTAGGSIKVNQKLKFVISIVDFSV